MLLHETRFYLKLTARRESYNSLFTFSKLLNPEKFVYCEKLEKSWHFEIFITKRLTLPRETYRAKQRSPFVLIWIREFDSEHLLCFAYAKSLQ